MKNPTPNRLPILEEFISESDKNNNVRFNKEISAIVKLLNKEIKKSKLQYEFVEYKDKQGKFIRVLDPNKNLIAIKNTVGLLEWIVDTANSKMGFDLDKDWGIGYSGSTIWFTDN